MLEKIWKAIVWFVVGTKRHALWLLATATVLTATFILISQSVTVQVGGMSLGTMLGLTAVTVDLVAFSAYANGNREISVFWMWFAFLTSLFTLWGTFNVLRGLAFGQIMTHQMVAVGIAAILFLARVMCLGVLRPAESAVKSTAKAAATPAGA